MTSTRLQWLAVGLLTVNLAIWMLGLHQGPAAPAAADRQVPTLPADLPRLVLVTETEALGTGNDESLCFTIGPLTGREAQDIAVERLRPFADSIRPRQSQADNDRGWWVYLPANSRAEARGLTRALAAAGDRDFYIITSGPMENRVSVGLFQRNDNAQGRASRLRALGFDAQVEIQRETIAQYWVDYRIGAEERSPWRFIIRTSPGATHRPIPCFDLPD